MRIKLVAGTNSGSIKTHYTQTIQTGNTSNIYYTGIIMYETND